jgi:hypothetical protein
MSMSTIWWRKRNARHVGDVCERGGKVAHRIEKKRRQAKAEKGKKRDAAHVPGVCWMVVVRGGTCHVEVFRLCLIGGERLRWISQNFWCEDGGRGGKVQQGIERLPLPVMAGDIPERRRLVMERGDMKREWAAVDAEEDGRT